MTQRARPAASRAPRARVGMRGLVRGALARSAAVAFGGGALAGLALPPLHLIPLAFVGFGLFAFVLDAGGGRRRAFADGWFFGAGYFLVGLYWLGLPVVVDIRDAATKDLLLAGGTAGTALLALGLAWTGARILGRPKTPWRRTALPAGAWIVAALAWAALAALFLPGRFAWMIPFAVFGMAAGLALFPALAALAVRQSGLRGIAGVLALALAWTAAEWLRGHILTGFPWNLAATIWVSVPAITQAAAWVGAYGLGFLAVLAAALPAAAFVAPTRAGRIGGPVGAILLLAALWGGGQARIPDAAVPPVEGVTLRLVQPAIPQRLKWDSRSAAQNLALHVDLSRSAAEAGATHVIWPETATGFFMTTDSRDPSVQAQIAEFRARLARIVPEGGALIAGAVRYSVDGPRFWNSVQALDDDGRVAATYDKHHLVPFGEYVPARGVLGALGVERLAQGRQDFEAGPGPRTLAVAGLPPFSPLVCYEAIFPGSVTASGARPGWLLNLTNDAWFGTSAGPYQHFASARLRAVEEGLPLVRVANTGISGVIDPFGRVVERLGLNRRAAVDVHLPRALAETPYAHRGDWMLAVLLLAGGILAGLLGWRRRNGP